MNKIRVAKKSEYVIEVNDNGDTISFNPEDPRLYLNALKVMEDIKKIEEKTKRDILLISKKTDTKKSNKLMSKKEKETIKAYDNMFQEMRIAMDEFLGEGACQKIFGDANYATMYDELFDELKPHFEKIGINAKNTADYIENKYSDKTDEDVIEA